MSDLAQSAEGAIGVIAEIKILVRNDCASQNNDHGPNQLAHGRPIDFSWISTGPDRPRSRKQLHFEELLQFRFVPNRARRSAKHKRRVDARKLSQQNHGSACLPAFQIEAMIDTQASEKSRGPASLRGKFDAPRSGASIGDMTTRPATAAP
jgi:hypothetical protein